MQNRKTLSMPIRCFSSLLCTFLVLLFHASSLASQSSSATIALSSQLLDFSSANIDPSTLKVLVNNEDVTKRLDIKQNASSVRIDYKLLTNLPAKANTEFIIQAKSRGTPNNPPVDLEAKSQADIVSKFAVTPVHIIKIPSYEGVLEDAEIATPVSVFSNGAMNIIYQEGDVLTNFRLDVPVFALDEKGSHLNIDLGAISLTNLSSGISSGYSSMTGGLAVIPLTISSSNLDSLEVGVGTVTIGSSSNAGAVLRPQVLLVVPFAIPVIILTAEQVATVFIGLGLAAGAILNPDPPRVPFKDWVDDSWNSGRFIPPISIAPPLPAPSGTCPTKPISVEPLIVATTQAPFRDIPALTAGNLSSARLPTCNGTWTPPSGDQLSNLKRDLTNSRKLSPNDISDPALLNFLNSNIFKYLGTAPLNKIIGLVEQVTTAISQNLPFLRSTVDATNVSPGPSRFGEPANAGATKHAFDLRNTLNGIKTRLLDRGKSGPNKTGIPCYQDSDLDVLYSLYEMINDALKVFDKWGGF